MRPANELKVKERGKVVKSRAIRSRSVASIHISSQPIVAGKVVSVASQKWGHRKLDLAPQARTRMGNRKVILSGVDVRSEPVRRATELYLSMISDLGGPDNISTMEDSMLRNLAFLQLMNEDMQRMYINKDPSFDVIIYLGGVKSAGSVARQLGIKRVARDMGKVARALEEVVTLEDHLKSQHQEQSYTQSDATWDEILGEGDDPAPKKKRGRPKNKKRTRTPLPD